MRVLLLRTWTTNIGNGFIDYGARAMLERAFPDAEIVETGGYPNHAADTAALWGGTRKLARMTGYDRGSYESPTHPIRQNTVNVSELIDADLAVLPGCVLSRPTFRKYYDTLRQLRERGIPIVVIGGGGEEYDEDERKYVEAVFDALDIDVLLTRDRTAYEEYGDLVEYLYDGIDCSLFLGDSHQPPNRTVSSTSTRSTNSKNPTSTVRRRRRSFGLITLPSTNRITSRSASERVNWSASRRRCSRRRTSSSPIS